MNLEPFLVNKRKSHSILWKWRVYFIYFNVNINSEQHQWYSGSIYPFFQGWDPADALFTVLIFKKYEFEHECAKGSIRLAYLLFAFSFKILKTEYTVRASIFFWNACMSYVFFKEVSHLIFFFFFLRWFLHFKHIEFNVLN